MASDTNDRQSVQSPQSGPEEFPAEVIRAASSSGSVVRLDAVWKGSEEEFFACRDGCGLQDHPDIRAIREGGCLYLYSERHMTRQYAEAAARTAAGDILRLIAETVRFDSAAYPRPTPLDSFTAAPYLLDRSRLTAAVEILQSRPDYRDIRIARASDDSVFLFSSEHLDEVRARSLAEWLAVGRFENP